jgi:hypothetical protein
MRTIVFSFCSVLIIRRPVVSLEQCVGCVSQQLIESCRCSPASCSSDWSNMHRFVMELEEQYVFNSLDRKSVV